MVFSKSSIYKPLIDSNKGQHLTAYLINDNNIYSLKEQLRETLDTAYEFLAPVMNPDALVRFLSPLHNVMEDVSLLKNLKGNIGLFRNEHSFRILSLPVSVEKTCVVATSFHVKPLLRWMQVDREFFYLGLDDYSVTLYRGSQNSFEQVGKLLLPQSESSHKKLLNVSFFTKTTLKKLMVHPVIDWLDETLFNISRDTKPKIFISGQSNISKIVVKYCQLSKIRYQSMNVAFNPKENSKYCSEIREKLKQESKNDLNLALMEFYQADDMNLANKNIFQIAKAAIKGRVRKLIIADGINIFGKIDRQTGGLAIHPAHIDHQDDDILDDLAQLVLAQGGEVIVASLEEIPKGRPILAILEKPEDEDHLRKIDKFTFDNNLEREII